MVIVSTGFRMSFLHPSRSSWFGLLTSTRQRSVVPSSFLASSVTHPCGLMNSNDTTVPCNVTGFEKSNTAVNEWCAIAGKAVNNTAAAMVKTANFRFFMEKPPDEIGDIANSHSFPEKITRSTIEPTSGATSCCRSVRNDEEVRNPREPPSGKNCRQEEKERIAFMSGFVDHSILLATFLSTL